MPNTLVIKNNSRSTPIVVSLYSQTDPKNIILDLENKLIPPILKHTVIVKGGTKYLIVRKECGITIWNGMIPSYGVAPIEIFPEKGEVKYREHSLPQYQKITDSDSGAKISRWKLAFIFLLIFILSFLIIYTGYNKI